MRRTAMSIHLRLLFLGAVVALTALAVGVVTAGAETPAATQPAAPAATTQPVAPATAAKAPAPALEAGMRAFIEPETGQLGTPAEMPVVTEDATKVAQEPVLVHMPDGSDMLELNGAFADYAIIKLDANGKKVVSCVEDPKAAQQAPPAPQREDR
jgi:hypothetical protein